MQDGICPQCGQAQELCGDEQQQWHPVRVVCHATMATRKAQRDYQRKHQKLEWHNGDFSAWSDKESDVTPYRYDDGVTVVVTSEEIEPPEFLTGRLKRATMGG